MRLSYFIASAVILATLAPGKLVGQSWKLEVYINPVMAHIGNVHIRSEGSSVFDYSHTAQWQKEAGMRLKRGICNIDGLGFGIGLGLKDLGYSLDYTVLNHASPAEVFAEAHRSYSLVLLGPTLALEYELRRLRFLMGIDIGIAIDRRASFNESDLLRMSAGTVVVREFEIIDYSVNIQEFSTWPHDGRRVYDLPEMRIAYQAAQGLSVHIGGKVRPYGKSTQHSIVSTARYIDSSSDNTLLQNFQIHRKALIGYIGLNYVFGL